MKNNNLLVLFLKYDQGNEGNIKYPGAYEYLKMHLDYFVKCEKNIIIVDNKKTDDLIEKVDDHTVIIPGNNKSWEFSGYQAGWELARQSGIDFNTLLVCNDSMHFPSPNQLIINDKSIEICAREHVLTGNLYRETEKQYKLGKFDVSEWVRTHCFLISRKMMENLGTFVSIDDEFFNACVDKELSFPYFKNDAPLNNQLRRHIIEWLDYRYKGFWHSSFKIDQNWDLFKGKVRAHFDELAWTARIKEAGFKILNV